MMESTREVYGTVKVGGKTPSSVWWSDEIKAVVRRKKGTWKGVFVASNKESKERCMEAYREKKRKDA